MLSSHRDTGTKEIVSDELFLLVLYCFISCLKWTFLSTSLVASTEIVHVNVD